ncbi:MAG TPA: hypothetical protein VFV38_43940 [Ktedonobacteraceae bacterium]|nr:hypothetical protein [Ktedonobacteraceae bacterium]
MTPFSLYPRRADDVVLTLAERQAELQRQKDALERTLRRMHQAYTPLTLKEAIRQFRAAARTLQQEQTQAAGDAYEQIYEDLQHQLSAEDSDQLFQVMMTLYCLGRI